MPNAKPVIKRDPAAPAPTPKPPKVGSLPKPPKPPKPKATQAGVSVTSVTMKGEKPPHRIVPSGGSSQKYGPCEVCKQSASDIQIYAGRPDGKVTFGHKECLEKLRSKEITKSEPTAILAAARVDAEVERRLAEIEGAREGLSKAGWGKMTPDTPKKQAAYDAGDQAEEYGRIAHNMMADPRTLPDLATYQSVHQQAAQAARNAAAKHREAGDFVDAASRFEQAAAAHDRFGRPEHHAALQASAAIWQREQHPKDPQATATKYRNAAAAWRKAGYEKTASGLEAEAHTIGRTPIAKSESDHVKEFVLGLDLGGTRRWHSACISKDDSNLGKAIKGKQADRTYSREGSRGVPGICTGCGGELQMDPAPRKVDAPVHGEDHNGHKIEKGEKMSSEEVRGHLQQLQQRADEHQKAGRKADADAMREKIKIIKEKHGMGPTPLGKAEVAIGQTRSGKNVMAPSRQHIQAEAAFAKAVEAYGHHHPEIDRAANTLQEHHVQHMKQHQGFSAEDHEDASKLHQKLANSSQMGAGTRGDIHKDLMNTHDVAAKTVRSGGKPYWENETQKSELLAGARHHYARVVRFQQLGKSEEATKSAAMCALYVAKMGGDPSKDVPAEVRNCGPVDLQKASFHLDREVRGLPAKMLPLIKADDQHEIWNPKTGEVSAYGQKVWPSKKHADDFIKQLQSQTGTKLHWKSRPIQKALTGAPGDTTPGATMDGGALQLAEKGARQLTPVMRASYAGAYHAANGPLPATPESVLEHINTEGRVRHLHPSEAHAVAQEANNQSDWAVFRNQADKLDRRAADLERQYPNHPSTPELAAQSRAEAAQIRSRFKAGVQKSEKSDVIGEVGKSGGKPLDIGDGYHVHAHGFDANGNHSVWVSKGSGRARKIQSGQNLPSVHSQRGAGEKKGHLPITKKIAEEIKDYHRKYHEKPVKKTEPCAPAGSPLEKLNAMIKGAGGASLSKAARAPRPPQEHNEDHVRELHIYADNDSDLHRQMAEPIHRNLANKMASGRYDHAMAGRAFAHLADAAAKKYAGQLGGGTFSVADRREVANRMADSFRDEAGLGNYDNLLQQQHQKRGVTLANHPATKAPDLARKIVLPSDS